MGKNNAAKALAAILMLAGMAFSFTLPNIFGQKTAAPENTNVTIYAPVEKATIFSNGMTFASRHAETELGKGNYKVFLQNLTSAASLETISLTDDSGAITEIQQYSKPVTETSKKTRQLTFDEILNKSTGKEITITTKNGPKAAVLRWHDDERMGLETEKGTSIVKIADVEEISTPLKEYSTTDEINTTTTESGLKFSEKSTASGKHSIDAKYLAQGAAWSANYKYYIEEERDKGSGTLQAWAKITNNLEDWDNIALQVVVGYPRTLNYNPPVPYYRYDMAYSSKAMEAGAPSIEPQFQSGQVTDYYVYEMKNAVTIKKGEEKEFPLLEGETDYTREYVWDTSWKDTRKIYTLTNGNKESWAAGALRVYLGGDLLGEDQITYTPTGKTAEAYVADVPDIKTDKIALSTQSETAGKSRITTYRMNITVENRKKEAVELNIHETMAGGDKVELIDSTIPPTSRTGNQLEWELPLAKDQKKEILYTYRVTNYYTY